MKRFAILVAFAGFFLLPEVASALPQWSVMAGRQCANCHVDAIDWPDPELSERKCTLSCNACHLSPTGGGMRTAGGRFFGREILAMFGLRPSEQVKEERATFKKVPVALVQSSTTTIGGTIIAGTATVSMEQPAIAASRPSVAGVNTPARFAGFNPRPLIQAGADLRMLFYFPQGDDVAVFPMQTDVYVAGSPYNPVNHNEGRLTLYANAGFLGSRGEKFDNFFQRFFLREYYAMFHDLPYQIYGRVGQFTPAFGYRLDDHTTFIRQLNSFDNERQVFGAEFGINPNYFFAHWSLYSPGPGNTRGISGDRNRFAVLFTRDQDAADPNNAGWKAFDNGVGTSLQLGWRDLDWQASTSFMYESRPGQSDLWVGANWALNMFEGKHPWKLFSWAPVMYLGEFDYRRTEVDGQGPQDGLTAFHEIDVMLAEGLFVQVRYDWRDPNLALADDHRHRATLGVAWHPYTFVEVITQYRFNVEAGEQQRNNEFFVQLHGWF